MSGRGLRAARSGRASAARCAGRPPRRPESTAAPAEAGVGSPPGCVIHGRGSTIGEYVQVPGSVRARDVVPGRGRLQDPSQAKASTSARGGKRGISSQSFAGLVTALR